MQYVRKSVLLVAIILSACWGDPRNTVIPTESEKWSELKPQIEKLSDKEKAYLASFMARNIFAQGFGGASLIEKGMTIGGAINKQKEFEDIQLQKEQEAAKLKAELEAKNKALTAQMAEVVTVAFISKSYEPSNFASHRFGDYITLKIGYKNKSDKDIIAVRSRLVFFDIFGERLGAYNLESEKNIKAGDSIEETYDYEVNKYISEQAKVASTDVDKLKTEIQIRDVVFSDKTKLSLEAASE